MIAQELNEIITYNTDNSGLAFNQINCIEFDDANRLWVGTENGLSVFEPNNNTWLNLNTINTPWINFPTNQIKSIEWADDLSSMLIGTSDGIVKYIDNDGELTENNSENIWIPSFGNSCSANNSIINCLLYYEGVWSGSADGLCIQYLGPEGNWLNLNDSENLYSNNFTSIKKNPNNDIIGIGTVNGGLIMYDGEFNVYYSENSDILDNSVLDLVFDDNNNTLITTPQAGLGILTYEGSWIWLNTENSEISSNSLQNITVDNNNNLWITTLENGLINYKNNIFYNYSTENSNLPDNKINCLKFGPNNNLWLGTNNSGLIKITNPTLGIESQNKEKICVFPTIFNYEINIELNNYAIIQIISQQGKLLRKISLESGIHQINTIQLESGLYYVLIQTENYNLVEKIIKY
tara:strand:+ start:4653 stop:5873 length:1221 start_codon:yes stop_codon:yes gene_type:complete